ncbi:hypothetical protein EST38_g6167 [Candolleomyces aberdarensis]|uniref:Uncharacterized protein n=1 Tax=Candolleomyces aberdarensis TaxID=2316362 RepID=A0A4Q2DLB9_9AGAR|nr:hypothetical protein EST38_g6167 [Candolleomyces aberdarensis]
MPSLPIFAPEILLYIFGLAAALDGVPQSETRLALSLVSHEFKRLVLATPSFWNTISIVFPDYPFPQPSNWHYDPLSMFEIGEHEKSKYAQKIENLLKRIEMFVSRSGNRTLNVTVDANSMVKGLRSQITSYPGTEIDPLNGICTSLDLGVFKVVDPLVGYLTQLLPRIGELNLSMPIVSADTPFRELLKLKTGDGSHLRKLNVQIDLFHYSWTDDKLEIDDERKEEVFLQPSNAYSLSLLLHPNVGEDSELEELQLPVNWSAITHLSLSAPDHHFPETDDEDQAIQFSLLCLQILGLCANIEHCEIVMPLLWTEPELLELEDVEINEYSCKLANLKSFKIHNLSQVAVGFAKCLELPSLEDLTLVTEDGRPDPAGAATSNLKEFATQFGSQLKTTAVHHIDLP